MHRIAPRRRKLRTLWASLALLALSVAACSALFTAWTWRQTRDLSQSFHILQERLEQVNTQRKAIVQLILEKRELLVGQRVKRDGKRTSAHRGVVGQGGVIKGWEERMLNMSKAVSYNKEEGTFVVEKPGVYFLFCQVLFNEQESQYVKLDVVTGGQRPQKLQCMEGYGTTPSAGPHPSHFLKPCQVSGLLRLDKGTQLHAVTGPSFRLHTVGNPSASPHVFSIFKVN
uniref:TNF superfamily member 12 n=1 Tax=Hippocampus comes TaxID=109280 RepID=A0A3Q2XUM1_HIPCM